MSFFMRSRRQRVENSGPQVSGTQGANTRADVTLSTNQQLYKFNTTPPGPRVVTEPPRDTAMHMFPPDPDAQFITHYNEQVNTLRTRSLNLSLGLSVSEMRNHDQIAHLLMYMLTKPSGLRTNNVNITHRATWFLNTWKNTFMQTAKNKKYLNTRELYEALNNLGFGVSNLVLDMLLRMFGTSDGNQYTIDYINFIRCCIFAESYLTKQVGPSSVRQ